MTDSLIDKWFLVSEKLAIWNRNPLKFSIQGRIPVDGCEYKPEPHMHVVFEVEVSMFGLPPHATIEEAVSFFGWGLTQQVVMAYMTSNIPDEIIWTGHVTVGFLNN